VADPASTGPGPGEERSPIADRASTGPGRFAIAVGRFYEDLADKLVEGARSVFEAAGAEVDVHDVPGAYELPLAAKLCAESGRYGGIACLGAVIRGETDHYDYVCAETARGIGQVSLDTGVPCAFGVLTVDNMDQALARAGGGKRHQGEDAARAVLRMAELRAELKG
jgi:6,7-dimethyl-8-ribityllumazine synthase